MRRVIYGKQKLEFVANLPPPFIYTRGTLGTDNCIYYAPIENSGGRIVKLNIITREVSYVGGILPSSGIYPYGHGVLGPDNCIYFPPLHAKSIVKVDIATQTLSYLGDFNGRSNWISGILAPNGKIYFIPFHGANNILILDVASQQLSLHPTNFYGANKFQTAAVVNNSIYIVPRNYNKVVKLDLITNVASEIGVDLGTNIDKYLSIIIMDDGTLISIPYTASNIISINPMDDSMTLSPIGIKGTIHKAGNGEFYTTPASSGSVYKYPAFTRTPIFINRFLSITPANDGWLYVNTHSPSAIYRFKIGNTSVLPPSDLSTLASSDYNKHYNKF